MSFSAILAGAYPLACTWVARTPARVDGGTWAGQMLVLAAIVPLAAVALTQAPFHDILGAMKGLLLQWADAQP